MVACRPTRDREILVARDRQVLERLAEHLEDCLGTGILLATGGIAGGGRVGAAALPICG